MSESRGPEEPRALREGDETALAPAAAFDPAARIHRVCVTCNNMFETDAAQFEAKQCPTCRRAG